MSEIEKLTGTLSNGVVVDITMVQKDKYEFEYTIDGKVFKEIHDGPINELLFVKIRQMFPDID